MNKEQELITIHHSIVDAVMAIVANLFLIEQISHNGNKVFIHDGIKIDINERLIVLGLKINLKDCLIEEHGERDGLNRAYGALRSMYLESNNKPIELTQEGREMLEVLFIGLVEDIQAEQTATIH